MKTSFEHFQKLVNECPIENVRKLWDKAGLITVCALVINSGGWLIYIVPILVLLLSFSTIKILATKLVIGLTDRELNKAFPPAQIAFVS